MVVIEERPLTKFTPFVTWTLILVNAAVFFAEINDPYLLEQFAYVPAYLLEGDIISSIITIFTSMFLHADIIHLVSNMYALWVFGDDAENVYGRGRFILFYLICGVGAALLYTFTTHDPYIPVVGASGALFGVMAAYAVFFPTRRLYVHIRFAFIPMPAIVYVLMYAAFEFLYTISGVNPYVAHTAHLGGFITGVVLSILYRATARPRIHKTRKIRRYRSFSV